MDFSVNIAAQIVGIVAIVIWLISIRQTNMKKITFFQIIANGLYGLQYTILTAFTAAGMNGLSFIRCFITYEYVKRGKQPSKYILIVFSILVLLVGVISYSGLISLIPVIITLGYVYSIWQQNVYVTYVIVLVGAIMWIVYNLLVGAYVTVGGNILEIVFSIVSIKKYNEQLEKKNKKKVTKK